MTKKDILCIICAALLFSTMEVALKIAGGDFDLFQITFIRFTLGGIFLLPFAIKQKKASSLVLTSGDWLYLAMLGILNICISMLFFQFSVVNAEANIIALIICANPLFVMIFAHFIVKERFTGRKALVLALGLTGLVFAANPFNMSEGNTVPGIIYGVLAMITFALYSTLGKLRINKIGNMIQTSFSFLIGSATMLILILIMDRPIISGIALSNIPILLYAGFAVTGIGYFTYFQAIKSCGPANASIVFFLKPMFAPVVALLVLGEAITWNIIVGIILLLTGSLINLIHSRKSEAAKPD